MTALVAGLLVVADARVAARLRAGAVDVKAGDYVDMFYARRWPAVSRHRSVDAGRIGSDFGAGRFAAHHRPVPHHGERE
jgi:hypothetical protein